MPPTVTNLPKQTAYENLFFAEDEVYIMDKNGRVKFGVVIKTFNKRSSDGEDDSCDRHAKGDIRVAWHPDGKEENHSELEVGLADRQILPADVVRRLVPGKDTQRGYVRELKRRADVQIVGTNYVVLNVDAERLRSITNWHLDTDVCLDSWVGKISPRNGIEEIVVLRSTYDALFEVYSSGLYNFRDVNSRPWRGVFENPTFFPGQVISGRLHSSEPIVLLTPDIPLKKNKKGQLRRGRYTVESIRTDSILVRWQGKALSEDYDIKDCEQQNPESYVMDEDLERLKRLNLFESCMQQIGARNFLKILESDSIMEKSEWDKENALKFKLLQEQQKLEASNADSDKIERSKQEQQINNLLENVEHWKTTVLSEKRPDVGSEVVTEALHLYSTATVVWQDGSIETDIPARQLYPMHNLDKHEFFPGNFVISAKEDSDISSRDYGVVQSVDHQGRIARVKWFMTFTSAEEAKPQYNGESEMSVYDLKDHRDFQAWHHGYTHPGITVIRIANFVGEDATCTAGQIIDSYTDGRVKVWWIDGHVSMCWPQEIFEISQYDHINNESDDPWDIYVVNVQAMRRLVGVHKRCRSLDRLLNTNFFSEDKFMGLLDVMRSGGAETILEHAQNRKNRIFNENTQIVPASKRQHQQQVQGCNSCEAIGAVNVESNTAIDCPTMDADDPNDLFNHSSNNTSPAAAHVDDNQADGPHLAESEPPQNLQTTQSASNLNCTSVSPRIPSRSSSPTYIDIAALIKDNFAKRIAHISALIQNIKEVCIETSELKLSMNDDDLSEDDSGNDSRNENDDGISKSYEDKDSDLTNIEANNLLPYKPNETSFYIELAADWEPEYICIRLCCLFEAQIKKCAREIRHKYYTEIVDIDDFVDYDSEEEEVEDVSDVSDVGEGDGEGKEENKILAAEDPEEVDDNCMSKEESALIKSTDCQNDKDDATVETTLQCVSVTSQLCEPSEYFQVLPSAPKTHKCYLAIFDPNNTQQYYKAVHRELRLLRTSLPPGVWVRVFEDRMDLVSVMIQGPKKTPYEDGMYLFDMQMGREYPKYPPLCQYISYSKERYNPNLYKNGKVCVSLLGTWTGRDSEVWGQDSTLLQVIVSIQGLILVPEPYFNEAGYEKQKGTLKGVENSRMYNEKVIIEMVKATTKLLQSPPDRFRKEILEHYQSNGVSMYQRLQSWMELSKAKEETPGDEVASNDLDYEQPGFPLVPVSRGFCLSLADVLGPFKDEIAALNSMNTDDGAAKTDQAEQ